MAAQPVLVLAVMALLSFLLPPAIVQAQASIRVSLGYDGAVFANAWMPASVTVINDGSETFRGQVAVKQLASSGHVPIEWRLVVEVPARAGHTYRLDLAWPVNGRSVQVTLYDAAGEIVAEQEVFAAIKPQRAPAVGFLGDRLPPFLQFVPLGLQGETPTVVHLSPGELPHQSGGLFPFGLVIIDGSAPLQALEQSQLRSLALWVRLGGVLFLGTGTDAGTMAQILGAELFPWQVTGAVEHNDYSWVNDIVLRTNPDTTPLDGAAVSVAARLSPGDADTGQEFVAFPLEGSPWLYRVRVGQGTVIAWTTRLDAEPWLSWAGTPVLLGNLLDEYLRPDLTRETYSFGFTGGSIQTSILPAPTRPGTAFTRQTVPVTALYRTAAARPALTAGMSGIGSPLTAQDGRLGWQVHQAASDLPNVQLPAPKTFLLYTGLYIIVAGPILFWLLSRRGRRQWAWWLVPVASVTWFTGAFLSELGAEPLADENAVGILFLAPDGQEGIWTGATAAFRPSSTPRLELAADILIASSTAGDDGSGIPRTGEVDLLVEATPAGWRASWPSPVGGQVPSISVQSDVVLDGAVTATLFPGGDTWQVRIKNESSVTLVEPVVMLGNYVAAQLDDLIPGSQQIAAVQADWRQLHQFTGVMSLSSLQPLAAPANPEEAWRLRRRARLASGIETPDWRGFPESVLLAWIEGVPRALREGPAATGMTGSGLTLLVIPLKLDLAVSSDFTLSSLWLPARPVTAEAENVELRSPDLPVRVQNGYIEFRWEIPADVSSRARTLQIAVPYSGNGVAIELWDPTSGRYIPYPVETSPAGEAVVDVADPAGFFARDGAFQFRIRVDEAELWEPQLTLQVGAVAGGNR